MKSCRQPSTRAALTKSEKADIDKCVKHFEASRHLFDHAAEAVVSACIRHPALKTLIHFIKHRLREPSSLRQKLIGKASKDKKSGRKPTITKTNLFQRVSDLAGVRILHLYTDQIAEINKHILAVFKEQRYRVVEGPIANIWDDEAKAYFNKLGIKSRPRKTMYTSIHYVVELNTASRVRCELQVRTLAEELWGEVSHTVDYPTPTRSIACKEQLKVLARVASGCTRLVDSIFRSRDEFRSRRSGSGVKQGRSAKRGRS